MGFSRQECWSGLPCPPPGTLPDPGIKPPSRPGKPNLPLGLRGKAGGAGSVPGLGKSLDEGTAIHSSILAWRIPWTEEPGGLQSIGLHFHIFHRHRVCLVDHVDLFCSLYNWWEGFGSSSLVTAPLGFNCGFISTSACGLSTGVCSCSFPGGVGSAPVRARCGGGAAAWVPELATPVTQGCWCLGQQEI